MPKTAAKKPAAKKPAAKKPAARKTPDTQTAQPGQRPDPGEAVANFLPPRHDRITVRGAREHNLRGVDVVLPRDSLIVFTGLSGSGKSSLAFDTIYAEGQRRYVESLSAYARQFLGQMDKPDVDFIEGLSPAISIDQKSASRNPRSTVGTITEVYDYLRLLYARIGKQYCTNCGSLVARQSPQQIVDRIMTLPEGTRFMVLAPIIKGRKGTHEAVFTELAEQGFARARVDGEVVEVADPPELARYEAHTIEAVIDRLVAKPDVTRRLTDSMETALKLSDGIASIQLVGASVAEVWPEFAAASASTSFRKLRGRENQDSVTATEQSDTIAFSEHLACTNCGISFEEVAPRNFSFNSPYGACEVCDGLGTRFQVDPELVVPDDSKTLEEGAIVPWAGFHGRYFANLLKALGDDHGFDLDTPWRDIPPKARKVILEGNGGKPLKVRYRSRRGSSRVFDTTFEGVMPFLQRRHSEVESDWSREQIEAYMREVPCPSCEGARLRPQSLYVRIDGRNIHELSELSIGDASSTLDSLHLSDREQLIASRVVKEIRARLKFLLDVGLDYLSLNRSAGTLSGGEAQRIRLASQIGSGLVGVLYVLDEPSIGLHQRDNKRLIETLVHLRDLGNTVLVVEHDEETIKVADHVVDVGPGAGEHGGAIVYSGNVEGLLTSETSVTGAYLSGRKSIPTPKKRRKGSGASVKVLGAREHNLKNIDVEFPLGKLVAVTGVSGSGKSTLVNDILLRALMTHVYGSKHPPGLHKKLVGLEAIDKVIAIDQTPIGRTPRSNPATYTGVFDHIRRLFSQTSEAKIRGYAPGRFSFNVKGGRCETCSGDGTIKIEMHFLPDVYVPCETCKGERYNRDTLEVHFKNKNISEVLDMSCEEALEVFANQPPIARHLSTLVDVGLGYVKLGQRATTLSGGEAQRVKLASELAKRSTGHTFYILDEPTTGLHFEDTRRLLTVLSRLVDQGNTVLVIEHNLDVIKTADWIIDLGPEGGSKGGQVLATGTPETVAAHPQSYTGAFLNPMLDTAVLL